MMKEEEENPANLLDDETALHEQFEKWLKMTAEPFDEWRFDGENYVVFVAGCEPEIYEPALVRELVGA